MTEDPARAGDVQSAESTRGDNDALRAAARERVRVIANVEPQRTFNHDKIEQAVRLMFEGLGLDEASPRIRETPQRVARMFDEIFAGLLVDPLDVLDVVFEEG